MKSLYFFLILSILLCNLLPLIQCDLIQETCKKTPDHDLCVSTLRSNPASSQADLKGLASMMVDAVMAKASETLSFIQELLKHTSDQQAEQSLAYCAELYIPLVRFSIPQAINALTKGEIGFVDYSIADAGNQADSCGKKLADTSPVVENNKLVQNLSAVSVAILKQLQ